MDNFQNPGPPENIPPPPPPAGTHPPGHPPYYAPPPPEEMGTGKVVGLSALACCIPLVGPIIALIIGIVERAKRGATVLIVIGGIMLVLSIPILGVYAAVAIPLLMVAAPESVQEDFFENLLGSEYTDVQDKAKEAELKANTHNIQLSCERYYVDNGFYPNGIQVLIQEGYIDVLPRNPFSDIPMQVMNLSDTPEAREGNFSYIPESTNGKITAYTLICFGSINTTDSRYPGGSGPAAVVLTLEGGVPASQNSQD